MLKLNNANDSNVSRNINCLNSRKVVWDTL